MQTKKLEAADLVVFRLDIHLWGGRQALRREQLIDANPALGDLPPQELTSMGSIHICDPEEIRVFERIKREAYNVVSNRGLPFLGALAVPQQYFQTVYDQLTELRQKFRDAAADLHANYDARAAAWLAKWRATNPTYAKLLGRMPTANDVAGRLSFEIECYQVAAPTAMAGHDASKAFETTITGLKGELLRDVAAEASELAQRYLVQRGSNGVSAQRETITNKTLRPLRRVAEKLATFGFLDPTVEPLAQVVRNVLARMPSEGPIGGAELVEIHSLTTMLCNPEHAAAVGASVAQVGLDEGLKVMTKRPVSAEVEAPKGAKAEADPQALASADEKVATLIADASAQVLAVSSAEVEVQGPVVHKATQPSIEAAEEDAVVSAADFL